LSWKFWGKNFVRRKDKTQKHSKLSFSPTTFLLNLNPNQALLIISNIFDLRVVLDCDWLAHQLVVRGTACHWLAVLCGSGWLELAVTLGHSSCFIYKAELDDKYFLAMFKSSKI